MTTSEATLIRKVRALAPSSSAKISSSIALGIGDDAALLRPRRGYETVLTCDWFLEGTHFLRDKYPADVVGWKSLARAVSDVAAMGGEPRCFLLSLALPQALTGRWMDQFLVGLHRASRKLGCPLAGGDTTRQSKVHINITVVGEVRANRAALRSGARPGDLIYVSGRLGEAELGFRLWSAAARRRVHGRARSTKSRLVTTRRSSSPLSWFRPGRVAVEPSLKKHLYPEPRLRLARWLTDRKLATAMMDLSDGLSSDLPRLCEASGVGAQVHAKSIPAVSVPKRNPTSQFNALALALNGGDDYELLFTVPRSKVSSIPRRCQGLPLTAIGEVTRDRSILIAQPDGRIAPLKPGGWDPFAH